MDTGAAAEPGFEDNASSGADGSTGIAGLPDMRDDPPSFEDNYGDDPDGTDTAAQGDGSGQEATPGDLSTGAEPGTRAAGGLEGMEGMEGTLTRAEQVAILDRQLEQSTSEFDTLILEEQQRQRNADRQRAERTTAEQAEPAGPGSSGQSPYQDDVALNEGGSVGGGMGGAGRTTAPQNPAIHKPPADIPEGNDDDVVARQLREAAMREPDPDVRERLWNEYRKYKGIEIPEE